MKALCLLAFAIAGLGPADLRAQTVGLPADSRLEAEQSEPLHALRLPRSAWTYAGADVVVVEGPMTRQAWQIAATGLTTAQMLAPLREQLNANGYETVFECAARDCGGFEFRYALDLLPEPAMHVDLGDYRYLLAGRSGAPGEEHVSIVVSRASGRGFIHITRIGETEEGTPFTLSSKSDDPARSPHPRPRADTPQQQATAGPVPGATLSGSLSGGLDAQGHAVLADLSFETGSSRLADTTFASLEELAAWLAANPAARIVLVGHTDTDGALAGNIGLSRKRAESVLDRLRDRYGIATDRMAAEGVGYLAPLVSNRTESGRTQNRRVEVVLVGDG